MKFKKKTSENCDLDKDKKEIVESLKELLIHLPIHISQYDD